ncbi:MAG: hypothetical protein WCC01_04445 [Acidimicrobiia bacterium]
MNPNPPDEQRPSPVGMAIGWVVAALLIFLAQRDLRRRPPEAVRGPVVLWRVVAGTPPGAAAYLLVGRRRSGSPASEEPLPA